MSESPDHESGHSARENERQPSPDDHDSSTSDLIPHDRRTSFNYAVPTEVAPFYDQNQLRRVKSIIEHAKSHEKLPRFWFTGPTGCGKTTAARRLAQELQAPLFTVQGLYDVKKTDLLGQPTLLDGTVYWEDGPVTRALRASKRRQTVLLIDEVNRARPEAKGVLFPILDGRASAHTGRGSEIISGDPHNLIVVVTTNEGPEYFTEQLDLAEQRRYGTKFEMTYLGQADFEAGVTLLNERTPVVEPLARVMLTAANKCRELSAEDGTAVTKGLPTALVLEWAKVADIYAQEGIDDPVVESFEDAVLRPFYDDNPDATQTIQTTIRSYLGGAPVEETAARDWVEAELEDRLRRSENSRLVRNVLAGDAFAESDLKEE